MAVPPGRLKRRAEFLAAAAKGRKVATHGLVLQALKRDDDGPGRLGFTVTKKVGNAVVRNRIRRRLREAIKRTSPGAALDDHDYVVMAREAALRVEFAALVESLGRAFAEIRRAKPRPGKSAETRDRRP